MFTSTPSICVVVVFSRANHRSGSGSGALRSPSHKKNTGSMLPPFPYLPLPSSPPYLPSPHPLVSSFLLTSATWTPNLDPFSLGWRLTLSQVFVRYSRFPEIQTLGCLKTNWPPLGFFPTFPLCFQCFRVMFLLLWKKQTLRRQKPSGSLLCSTLPSPSFLILSILPVHLLGPSFIFLSVLVGSEVKCICCICPDTRVAFILYHG